MAFRRQLSKLLHIIKYGRTYVPHLHKFPIQWHCPRSPYWNGLIRLCCNANKPWRNLWIWFRKSCPYLRWFITFLYPRSHFSNCYKAHYRGTALVLSFAQYRTWQSNNNTHPRILKVSDNNCTPLIEQLCVTILSFSLESRRLTKKGEREIQFNAKQMMKI